MKLQSAVTPANSEPVTGSVVAKVPLRKGTFTASKVPGVELGSSVVPQASMPRSNTVGGVPAVAGLQTVKAPVLSVPGRLAISLITMDVGTAGVRLLLIRSDLAERELSPFGVTRQAQQPISSSCGSNT